MPRIPLIMSRQHGREGEKMFGLPWSTTLLVFGFPLIWILYTVGFLLVTRDWGREDGESR